jgi:hypothetical protein
MESTENIEISPAHTPNKRYGEKKSRWRPSPVQKQILETMWAQNPYPPTPQKKEIAQLLEGVSYKQVTSWFKHKRENSKAQGLLLRTSSSKFTQQQLSILEAAFQLNPYSRPKVLQSIATEFNVPVKKIQNWFKHKRSRLKIDKKSVSDGTRVWEGTLNQTNDTKKTNGQESESSGDENYLFEFESSDMLPALSEEDRLKKAIEAKQKFNKSEPEKEFIDLAPLEPYDLFSHNYVFRPLEGCTSEHPILPEQEYVQQQT